MESDPHGMEARSTIGKRSYRVLLLSELRERRLLTVLALAGNGGVMGRRRRHIVESRNMINTKKN